jgi:hypothetical protein
MNFPNPGTILWKIGVAIIERGPLTIDQLHGAIEAMHKTINKDLRDMIEADFVRESGGFYSVGAIFQQYVTRTRGEASASQGGEIVPPRVVDLLHRKPWVNHLNPAGNRPDTGPAHDITHYSSGTVAEPKINGCAL